MIDVYECVGCGIGVEYSTEDLQEHDEFESCRECFEKETKREVRPLEVTLRRSHLRGHSIIFIDGEWVYADSGEPTTTAFRVRPCGYCGLPNTPEDHDGCLGTLRDIMNACCGHGVDADAYVQYWDGSVIRGVEAKKIQEQLKRKGNES